jgi:Ca2+-binding RTX toxin-like protein
LQGGTGDDKLFGEAGNDQLHGGQGIDQLHGGVDEDVCTDPANEAGTKTACEKP